MFREKNFFRFLSDPFWTPDCNPKWGPIWGPNGLEKIEKKISRNKFFYRNFFYQIYRKTGPNLVLKFFLHWADRRNFFRNFEFFRLFHRFLGWDFSSHHKVYPQKLSVSEIFFFENRIELFVQFWISRNVFKFLGQNIDPRPIFSRFKKCNAIRPKVGSVPE